MDTLLKGLLVISSLMLLHNVFVFFYLKVFAVLNRRDPAEEKAQVEKISVIMPVYNEEQCIRKKLENIRACLNQVSRDYQVLIGSDGSTDGTDRIIEAFIQEHHPAPWKLFRFKNQGKGQTINKLVHASDGDLVISTDADTQMDADAFETMIHAFDADSRLGCLSCVPQYQARDMKIQMLYWRYELALREAESRIGKLIVSTGWLYAFRRKYYQDIPAQAMADDLWIPLTILLQNRKSAHISRLKALSEWTDERTEVQRRTRVITGGVDIIKRLFSKIVKNPGLFFVVFSHKINRWLAPLWIGLFGTAAVILQPKIFFVFAALLLACAVVLKPQRLYLLLYSVFSPVLSLLKFLMKKDFSKWDHTRK